MESKIELTERLRREGRWPEASKFKDTALADFRAKGMKRDEASEEAWAAMAEAYPPLPVAEVPVEPAAGAPEAVTTDATPIPWSDLPTDADFDAEVRWVHQQYILIIEETPRSRVIHWERATKKPPSTGACSLARWAADNRTAFYKDLLPRTMAKANANQEEEVNIREEKKSIEELRGILQSLNQQWAEELVANVPETVRAEVRSILGDWARRSALIIPSEAKADLEAHLGDLVQRCAAATAPASGAG